MVETRGIVRWALHPLMRGWGLGVLRGLRQVPRPLDHPQAHAAGVDSDRVLLFGSGASVGWGVLKHDLALPGMLARALSALTGRGTDVDVLAEPEMSAASAIRALGAVNLWRYDAIIITLGLNEVVQLAPLSAWRRDLDALLDYVANGASRYARIYVVGVHQVSRITPFDSFVAPIARRHRIALNRITIELCARGERANYLPFNPVRNRAGNRYRTADDYREGARALSSHIAKALDRGFEQSGPCARRERASGSDESARQQAVDALGIIDTAPEEKLDRVVAHARRAFGTAFAALTIIDHDRQWNKSRIGLEQEELPRDVSLCATTIQQSGALVVADASTDDRFKDNPLVVGEPHVRFYAGFPVEAPTGERIGALCVFDSEVREVSNTDRALLRELALLVQKELWERAGV